MTLVGSEGLSLKTINRARMHYISFIQACAAEEGHFRLTPRSETTPFALCFAVFGLGLLKRVEKLANSAEGLQKTIKSNLVAYKKQRESIADLTCDKPFLQLLTFTMSALHILGRLHKDPLEEVVLPLLSSDIRADLCRIGVPKGTAQSGNMAMFKAILLVHARDYLGINTQSRIDAWVELHLRCMNDFGFWGDSRCMTHLQFQNGYHQYEILDYLGVHNPKKKVAAESVADLVDREGHFAPYPGGGGCYDYDAICILTSCGQPFDARLQKLLLTTASTILSEQNADGGFAESHQIRPRSFRNVIAAVRHVMASRGRLRRERLRNIVVVMRPKHDRIHTHWSVYSRRWDESNLWDSWFRMLTLARIQVAFDSDALDPWGFICYQGIGFHRMLLRKAGRRKRPGYVP